jgi:hypothetical protein
MITAGNKTGGTSQLRTFSLSAMGFSLQKSPALPGFRGAHSLVLLPLLRRLSWASLILLRLGLFALILLLLVVGAGILGIRHSISF